MYCKAQEVKTQFLTEEIDLEKLNNTAIYQYVDCDVGDKLLIVHYDDRSKLIIHKNGIFIKEDKNIKCVR